MVIGPITISLNIFFSFLPQRPVRCFLCRHTRSFVNIRRYHRFHPCIHPVPYKRSGVFPRSVSICRRGFPPAEPCSAPCPRTDRPAASAWVQRTVYHVKSPARHKQLRRLPQNVVQSTQNLMTCDRFGLRAGADSVLPDHIRRIGGDNIKRRCPEYSRGIFDIACHNPDLFFQVII